jgi:hypothetical protein
MFQYEAVCVQQKLCAAVPVDALVTGTCVFVQLIAPFTSCCDRSSRNGAVVVRAVVLLVLVCYH